MKSSICSFLLIGIMFWPCPMNAKTPIELVLCTWNIGHFSNGSKPYSLIRVDEYKEQLELYRTFVYKELCPTIITVNEYNRVFCGEDIEGNEYVTSSLLFDDFKRMIVGPQCYWGICNAVFSNVKISNERFIYFKSHKKIEDDDFTKSRENYFIESDLYIQGKNVKLVCLHLLFSQKVSEVYQQNQMEELISRYKETDRIIMCGDWNTGSYTSLKNAGYSLANDGSLQTFPSKGYALDNIAVKGLKISDVRMIKTHLSDHYPLLCRISLK